MATKKKPETQDEVQEIVIPNAMCPDMIQYLSDGKMVHVQVYALKTDKGLVIKDVEYKR